MTLKYPISFRNEINIRVNFRLIHLMILNMICIIAIGQDTLHLDSNWAQTSKKNSSYYGIINKNDVGFSKTLYTSNHQVVEIGNYSSINLEIKVGDFKSYYSNGNLKINGEYADNKRIGKHKNYHQNGKISIVENYCYGVLDGEYTGFHENGARSIETSYTNGLQNGITKYYHENDSLKSEGLFFNDNKSGNWKYYDEQGNFIITELFSINYSIEEAGMTLSLPNNKWSLKSKKTGELTYYIFHREPVYDGKGNTIIPTITVYIEDAQTYTDLADFSSEKQKPFTNNGVTIDQTLNYKIKEYPIPYKNSYLFKTHYSNNNIDHLLYMIHILTKEKTGVQIIMDMTEDIASVYEHEFIKTLESIKID